MEIGTPVLTLAGVLLLLLNLFMCIGVKVSDPLELGSQTVVNCYAGAGN